MPPTRPPRLLSSSDVTVVFEDTPDYLALAVIDELGVKRAYQLLMLMLVLAITIAAFVYLLPALRMLLADPKPPHNPNWCEENAGLNNEDCTHVLESPRRRPSSATSNAKEKSSTL